MQTSPTCPTSHNTGPCHRCIVPECPPPTACSRCADAGVLGPVPGVIGLLQAMEAIKVLTSLGSVLSKKLLLYDALAAKLHVVTLRGRRPACPACGEHPTITKETLPAYDYGALTGWTSPDDRPISLSVLADAHRVTPQQLLAMLSGTTDGSDEGSQKPLLLDTRPSTQFAIARLPGAMFQVAVVKAFHGWCAPGSVNVPFDESTCCVDQAAAVCAEQGTVFCYQKYVLFTRIGWCVAVCCSCVVAVRHSR